jgi:hypothetical protein
MIDATPPQASLCGSHLHTVPNYRNAPSGAQTLILAGALEDLRYSSLLGFWVRTCVYAAYVKQEATGFCITLMGLAWAAYVISGVGGGIPLHAACGLYVHRMSLASIDNATKCPMNVFLQVPWGS